MRFIASAVIAVVALAAVAGCANIGIDTAQDAPQNEGANADVRGTLHIRNAFLLSGSGPASPASQQATLYAVLINQGQQPARLERIVLDGGGSVQLPGPVELPPHEPVGAGEQPIGTVTGVRGGTVPMTFVFTGIRPVRLYVPVKERTGQYATLTPAPAGSPSPTLPGTAPPSPSPTGSPSPSGPASSVGPCPPNCGSRQR